MKPVVITRLMGGLGNQMFQYAAGRSLSEKFHVPLLLDRSFLDKRGENLTHTIRDLEIDAWQINASIATQEEITRLERVDRNPFLRRIAARVPSLIHNRIFRAASTKYNPAFEKARPPVLLDGFWQSEKYFKNIRPLLLREFQPVDKPEGRNVELLSQISSSNSISIHVRRGDYVTNPGASRFHGACSIDYYERAAARMKGISTNPLFFIFSDELEWVKENIQLPSNTVFVSHNKGRESYWDLFLMRNCRHHIIANSSFSWWGAWLGEFPGKKVMAPGNWFSDPLADASDIVPPEWLRL
ncbi:MAG TPA: alpha-1,2-fucosyltransferase [Bacteroidia bacterium]|nr:alpha-1,2-fucosyltransferase [Bacteroidia bacterium]